MLTFSVKNDDIGKINEVMELKGIFSETTYACILTCRNLTIFRQGKRGVNG